MAAFVFSQRVPIDPDSRKIVDGAEVQQHTRAVDGGRGPFELEVTLVPASGVKAGVTDAAHPAFGCERHFDGQGPVGNVRGLAPFSLRVEGETPLPVEGYPSTPLQHRPRMQSRGTVC
jgi:hypothetical protein